MTPRPRPRHPAFSHGMNGFVKMKLKMEYTQRMKLDLWVEILLMIRYLVIVFGMIHIQKMKI